MGTAGVPRSDLRHDDDAALAERVRSRDVIGRRWRLGQEEEDRLLVITARRSDRRAAAFRSAAVVTAAAN